jgi:hypothetical protein
MSTLDCDNLKPREHLRSFPWIHLGLNRLPNGIPDDVSAAEAVEFAIGKEVGNIDTSRDN